MKQMTNAGSESLYTFCESLYTYEVYVGVSHQSLLSPIMHVRYKKSN
jgi:hypothetical protein